MAKIHVLEGSGSPPGIFRVIVHANTPAGNNSAGVSWATALINSGRAFTRMVEGNGAGQITTAEKASVLAGTVMEGAYVISDDVTFTGPQRAAYLDSMADRFIAEMMATAGLELKYFGATSG